MPRTPLLVSNTQCHLPPSHQQPSPRALVDRRELTLSDPPSEIFCADQQPRCPLQQPHSLLAGASTLPVTQTAMLGARLAPILAYRYPRLFMTSATLRPSRMSDFQTPELIMPADSALK